MSKRNYTREQQRRYREERQKQAKRVADTLLGKKKVDPDVESFFSGTQIQSPSQWQLNYPNTYSPRNSFVLNGFNGV